MSGPSHRTIRSERKAAAESSVYDPSCTVTVVKTYLRRNQTGRRLPLRGMRTSARRPTFLARPGQRTQKLLRTTAWSFCYPNSEEATKAQFRVPSAVDRGHGKTRALRSSLQNVKIGPLIRTPQNAEVYTSKLLASSCQSMAEGTTPEPLTLNVSRLRNLKRTRHS